MNKPHIWLAVLVFAAYIVCLTGPAIYDDMAARVPVHLDAFLHNGRPLSDWLHIELGTDMFAQHLVSIALHALASLAVFQLLVTFGAPAWPAFAGAAVFAMHPMASEAVAYASGRPSLLCGLFYFLTLLAVAKFTKGGSRMWLIAVGASGMLAFWSKQEAVTIPLAVLAMCWIMQNEWPRWRVVALSSALMMVLAVAQFGTEFYSRLTLGSPTPLVNAGAVHQLYGADAAATSIATVPFYFLPRFVLPLRQSIDPDIEALTGGSAKVIIAAIVLCALATTGLALTEISPLLRVGIALVVFAPWLARALNAANAGFIEEHHAYIPLLGFAFVAAEITRHIRRSTAVVCIAILFALTAHRAYLWADPVAMWTDAASKAVTNPRPHVNLGAMYLEQHQAAGAKEQFQIALDIDPKFAIAASDLAAIDIDTGDIAGAEKVLVKLTAERPDYAEGFLNLGIAKLRQQKMRDAWFYLERARQLSPTTGMALYNQGEVLLAYGDAAGAMKLYSKALKLQPELSSMVAARDRMLRARGWIGR